MSVFYPDKLLVTLSTAVSATGPLHPRRYTLTHSDSTGDLFLTIGRDYDRSQISGWYTRIMRDEVLAEWKGDEEGDSLSLHLYCHVSGGLIVGNAGWRYSIFQHHLRQVLQSFRHGDRQLFSAHPELDEAEVFAHFQAKQAEYNKVESWGRMGEYK